MLNLCILTNLKPVNNCVFIIAIIIIYFPKGICLFPTAQSLISLP